MPRSSRPSPASRAGLRGRRIPRLGVLVAVLAVAVPAVAMAADTATGGTIGTFRFSGELAGTLKVPKRWNLGYTLTQPGCEKTVDKTSFNLFFYNVKLKLNGHKADLNGAGKNIPVIINVQVNHYGGTEPFADQGTPGGVPDFVAAIGLNAQAGRKGYSWESNAGSSTMVSGTVTTNPSGTGGSLTATMVPTGTGLPTGASGHAIGLLHVKGSWSHCVPFKE